MHVFVAVKYYFVQVNFFVGAFYDAVWLYGMTLNRTLKAGDNITDGYNMIRNYTWDRHFLGKSSDVITEAEDLWIQAIRPLNEYKGF